MIDHSGTAPLHYAAFNGNQEIIAMLLAHHPPVDIDMQTNNNKESALLTAARHGHIEVVKQLTAQGANVTLRDFEGYDALDLAAQFGKAEVVTHLLRVHPDMVDCYRPPQSKTNVFVTTPMHIAVRLGHKQIVLELLAAGVDPNVYGTGRPRGENIPDLRDDGTPLHVAVFYSRASIVRILLTKGANLYVKNRDGLTVKDLLIGQNNEASRKIQRVIHEYEKMNKVNPDSEDERPTLSVSPTGFQNPPGNGLGRRRWDETEATSEGDALSISSAASSCAPHHLGYHHDYSKVSPTPPKKPPRRNLSVSPTHANSPSSGYSYELRTHARSQDDLDEIQGAKIYLKHGRSVDQYVDGKLSYAEYEENHNPRVIPVPNPRPSLKNRPQPVAITAMYENVVIKEQNPRRKLRRSFGPQSENERMNERVRKYSNQERSSSESLLDAQATNSPSECERRWAGPPLSPTHYAQPPTPDHPPPSARHAERSIHERIRPLSQLIMEVVEEIRIRKKSQGDISGNS